MAGQRETTPTVTPTTTRAGRRGILAAAAGVVAALAAKAVTDPAPVAANGQTWSLPYDSGAAIAAGTLVTFSNTGTGGGLTVTSAGGTAIFGRTSVTSSAGYAGVTGQGNGPGTFGVIGVNTDPGISIYGQTGNGTAVLGISTGTGSGVSGTNTGSGTALSGINSGTGYGMFASATGSYAVYGRLNGSVAGTAGVAGSGGGAGTYGVSGVNSATGTALYGQSFTGVGVLGVSGGGSSAGSQPYGVAGAVSSAPGFALYGLATVAGTVAFAGGATVAGAIAGQLSGPVNIYNTSPSVPGNLYVQGNSTVSGTKSAAVPHPDGSHRLLYCMEAPEAWFEDFGKGTLTAGKATVKLDPDFAAVVDTSTLHVFLTPHDEHHLHVPQQSATGFTVQVSPLLARAAGVDASAVNGAFTWRVVAKRKDVTAPRLAKFTVPQAITAPALVIPPPPPPAKAVPPMPLPPFMPLIGGTKG